MIDALCVYICVIVPYPRTIMIQNEQEMFEAAYVEEITRDEFETVCVT